MYSLYFLLYNCLPITFSLPFVFLRSSRLFFFPFSLFPLLFFNSFFSFFLFPFSFFYVSFFLLFPSFYPNIVYFLCAFFPVLGATVNADPHVVPDDQSDAFDTPLASELLGSTVNVQQVKLSNYRYEELWIYIEQIADATFPQRDIQSNHIKILFASMCPLTFDHRNGMITVIWSAEYNTTDSSMEDSVV